MFHRCLGFSAFWLMATVLTGQGITVADLKGRSIEIEVVSVAGDTVTFTRGGKKFTLPIGNFEEASQTLIRSQTPAPATAEPAKIVADVVIGKRRKDQADSYYMEKQEITCTIKLTNGNKNEASPPVTTKIVFFGQNSRTPDIFSVLSNQSLEFTLPPGKTVEQDTKVFYTTYDSDNKGYGNIGGFQYYGYVLAIVDANGKVISSQTTTGAFRTALAAKEGLIDRVIAYSNGTRVSNKLESGGGGQ